mmetsp:Transcript_9653/g.14533  ORF Transcript_9653/g.14533 Transcript_9653/m.14533 type:complete len:324 (+) Transcript_9653:50-1021(+)|eukprot:CAMPEP_0201553238 /NCGR_PEP_ID=MMETSP0173_2-20130828/19524_1 /ASSEMBLY_ACC=CAM_ASM_000268 /TAXON_ID=218659 /ORGANISM="Vexillifera sp., Strain DIVA3 564/2" /LENGTH=323 /DNA_ID=CAMNT_0047963875 /DNA_START=37 /DNA_END=1008 /DNA_ORIENTATION=-
MNNNDQSIPPEDISSSNQSSVWVPLEPLAERSGSDDSDIDLSNDDNISNDDQDHALLNNNSSEDDELGLLSGEIEEQADDDYWQTPVWKHISQRLPLLLTLLLLQSLSSFILSLFQNLIEQHIVITLYLTMLVGTGGNAGGQSAATAIQGLANGQINRAQTWHLLAREITISFGISAVIGFIGFWRVFLMTSSASVVDALAVAMALVFIVITSIVVGSGLPMLMDYLMEVVKRYAHEWAKVLDPANTTFPVFQVVMDILGILIVCGTATVIYATVGDRDWPCECECKYEGESYILDQTEETGPEHCQIIATLVENIQNYTNSS